MEGGARASRKGPPRLELVLEKFDYGERGAGLPEEAAAPPSPPRPPAGAPARAAADQKLFKRRGRTRRMICGACEKRRHYECIDCVSNHSTYLCSCDCHDRDTGPHGGKAGGHGAGR